MKTLIALAGLLIFSSCGGNGGTEAVGDSTSVKFDTTGTAPTGTMNTDSGSVNSMSMDTTGMSKAK